MSKKLPAKGNDVMKMTKEDKKSLEDTPRSPEEEYRPVVDSNFDDGLSEKLAFVYTASSMAFDYLSLS